MRCQRLKENKKQIPTINLGKQKTFRVAKKNVSKNTEMSKSKAYIGNFRWFCGPGTKETT